jgi:hypothetical protein
MVTPTGLPDSPDAATSTDKPDPAPANDAGSPAIDANAPSAATTDARLADAGATMPPGSGGSIDAAGMPDLRPATPDAITPPDLAPPVRTAGIIVSNSLAPSFSDQIMRRHLEARGLKVSWLAETTVPAETAGAALVVISSDVRRFASFVSLRDSASAIIVMRAAALDDLDMTGANRSIDFDDEDTDDLLILDDRHPLAAGLHGTLPFSATDQPLGWGHPSSQASRVAGLAAVPAKFAIFAYDKGAQMISRPAPGRRVALLIGADRISDREASEASRLFDAAVDWSLR